MVGESGCAPLTRAPSYSISGTPCAGVLEGATRIYASDVQALFPEDRHLATSGVDGYVGACVFDSAGEALGIIAGLHARPIEAAAGIARLLDACAPCVAAEIKRGLTQDAIHESEVRFRTLVENAPGQRVVLLVDDHEGLGRAMQRVLGSRTDAVRQVATVAEAIRFLETEAEPQLVFCDLNLARGTTAPLLEWIVRTRPALCPRVLILTGGATGAEGHQLLAMGRFRVLTKPVLPERLLEIVAQVSPNEPRGT